MSRQWKALFIDTRRDLGSDQREHVYTFPTRLDRDTFVAYHTNVYHHDHLRGGHVYGGMYMEAVYE